MSEQQSNQTTRYRWVDDAGACRVCGGEIPHGHDLECDVHKMQQEIRMLREANAAAVAQEQVSRNEANRLRRELGCAMAEIDGVLMGLNMHPDNPDGGEYCISPKSKEKLQVLNEIRKRYGG